MVRSKKDIMRSLLKRAFQENRGSEVILLILWRKSVVAHENSANVKEAREFDAANFAQPRAVKLLNLAAQKQGVGVKFDDNSRKPNAPGSATLN